MKKFILLTLVSLALGGCSIVAKTPEPNWTSIRKDGDIEIRSYDPMIVAEVVTKGERYDAINAGFRILAGYIFGGNQGQKKLAMTAPVIQQPQSEDGEKLAMTAPVMATIDMQNFEASAVVAGVVISAPVNTAEVYRVDVQTEISFG